MIDIPQLRMIYLTEEKRIITRKKYTKKYKLDAVSLVKDQNLNRSEAARNLGINANMLGRWVKESDSDDGLAFRGNGQLTPEQEEK